MNTDAKMLRLEFSDGLHKDTKKNVANHNAKVDALQQRADKFPPPPDVDVLSTTDELDALAGARRAEHLAIAQEFRKLAEMRGDLLAYVIRDLEKHFRGLEKTKEKTANEVRALLEQATFIDDQTKRDNPPAAESKMAHHVNRSQRVWDCRLAVESCQAHLQRARQIQGENAKLLDLAFAAMQQTG